MRSSRSTPAWKAASRRSITGGTANRSSGGWRPRCSTLSRGCDASRTSERFPCSVRRSGDRSTERRKRRNERAVTDFQLRMGLTLAPQVGFDGYEYVMQRRSPQQTYASHTPGRRIEPPLKLRRRFRKGSVGSSFKVHNDRNPLGRPYAEE